MAELHIIGEISSGLDFGGGKFFCVFEILGGSGWSAVEGTTSGCTHIMSSSPEDDEILWNFPIDTHFSFTNVQGWPKLSVQVWKLDGYGRKDIAGYGMAYLPMPIVGEQKVEILTWKPLYWSPHFFQRLVELVRNTLMGASPVLRDTALIHGNEERFKLHTIGSGKVVISLRLLCRGMSKAGLVYR